MLFARLAAEGLLPLRVHASVRGEQLDAAIDAGLRSGDGTAPSSADPRARRLAARYRVGWLKLFADGTLGSLTAAMLAPFEPLPGDPPPSGPAGALLLEADELEDALRRAAAAGISGQVHAIGDRAVRVALDALEAVSRGSELPLRPRVEHAQIVDPTDLPRFARLGVTASVQPVHLRTDAAAARRAWGARIVHSYPYARLASTGALVAFGSDAPVEPADPWPAVALAVTRRHPSWAPSDPDFVPDQALDLARGIRAACLDPVLSAGEGSVGGRLLPGMRADLIVVPAAALDEPVTAGGALFHARPLLTLLDGDEVFRDRSWDRA
jgi:predicted amidohydrolase YtcJ